MRRRADDGFTLVEAIVALIILASVAAAGYQVFAGGWRATALADGDVEAVTIAEARLAEAGVLQPLAVGTTSGRTGDGFIWSVESSRYQPPAEPSPKRETGPALPAAYWIVATVIWRPAPGAAERRVSLRTLKLEPPR